MTKPSELTADQVRAIRASDEPTSALAERYGLMPAMVGRIQKRLIRKDVSDMTDPTAEGAEEGAQLTPEEIEARREATKARLEAIGVAYNPQAELPVLTARLEAVQKERLIRDAQALGISCNEGWTIEALQDAIEAKRMGGGDLPEGIHVKHATLGEDEGEEVTSISQAPISLGDGQKLNFKEKALVPSDMAAALREKDLCL